MFGKTSFGTFVESAVFINSLPLELCLFVLLMEGCLGPICAAVTPALAVSLHKIFTFLASEQERQP